MIIHSLYFLLTLIILTVTGCGNFAPITDIHDAVYSGSTLAVRQVMLVGDNINKRDAQGRTPLMLAVERNEYEIAKLLMESGVDEKFVMEVFVVSVSIGNIKMIDLFLEKKIDHFYAVAEAASSSDVNVLDHLLRNGSSRFSRQDTLNYALLMSAMNGKTEIIEYLLKNNAEVDPVYDSKKMEDLDKDYFFYIESHYTPLTQAARFGHIEIVKKLHKLGSRLDGALYFSIQQGFFEIAEYAIQQGLDVNKEESTFPTILHDCLWSNDADKVINFLHDLDVELNEIFSTPGNTYTGKTPLLICAEKGNHKALERFIHFGVNVVQFHNVKSALDFAVESGSAECVKLILENGGESLIQSLASKTILITAYGKRNVEMINLLMKHGADVNAKDIDGMTILDYAKEMEDQEMMDLLTAEN